MARLGVVLAMTMATVGTAQTYTVLKSFTGADGSHPYAGLALSGSTLYGTTWSGGMSNCGVVFKVGTDGSGYTVLKHFTGSDGANAEAGLALGGATLYGTTRFGGNSDYGVVFKLNTDGTGYAVLKTFTGLDGAWPDAELLWEGGTLYGTTYNGGEFDCGVVFSFAMRPPSITTPPSSQTAEDGTTPWFFVEVTNTPPESAYYRWFFSGTNALDGATNSCLRVASVRPAQAGAYTVVVTNLYGAVTSDPALLSVIAPVSRRVVPAVALPGGTGSVLHLEYADRLASAQWFSLTNGNLSSGPQLCFDLSQPLPAQRFYRAWQTNGPQATWNMSMASEIPLAGTVGSSIEIDYINQFGPTNAWVTLDAVKLTNSPQLYFDVSAFRQAPRLYRLVPLP